MVLNRLLAELEKPRRSKWRTYKALGHTLASSSRVVARSLLGRLDNHHAQAIIDDWVQHLFDTAHIHLAIHGRERLDPEQQVLLMSNHASLLDIPCVFRAAPMPVRAISKQELRSVPVFGRAMEDIGVIFVDRKNLEHAKQQLEEGKRVLRENNLSLWVAAEGTRSRTGALLPFKKGGFHLATQLEIPIVPTWISGTLKVIPPDQWESVTHQAVSVSFGAPIDTRNMGKENIPELMDKVRQEICLLYTSPSPRDLSTSRMPSSA